MLEKNLSQKHRVDLPQTADHYSSLPWCPILSFGLEYFLHVFMMWAMKSSKDGFGVFTCPGILIALVHPPD